MLVGARWRGLVRQGDLLLVPVAALPDGARELGPGRLVLLRGEATRRDCLPIRRRKAGEAGRGRV